MLCENCGQKNATSIYMSPKESKLKYFCGVCYRQINNENDLENFAYMASAEVKIEAKCLCCGISFEEVEKKGLFGCEECYKTFKEFITKKFLPNFKEQKYLGKKPNAFYIRQEIKNLEQLIESCLKNGNFQKATIYGRELEKLKADNYDQLQ